MPVDHIQLRAEMWMAVYTTGHQVVGQFGFNIRAAGRTLLARGLLLLICIIPDPAHSEAFAERIIKITEFGVMKFTEGVSISQTAENIMSDRPTEDCLYLCWLRQQVAPIVHRKSRSWQNHRAIRRGGGEVVTHIIFRKRHSLDVILWWIPLDTLDERMEGKSRRIAGIPRFHGKVERLFYFESVSWNAHGSDPPREIGIGARDKHHGNTRQGLYPHWPIYTMLLLALACCGAGYYGILSGLALAHQRWYWRLLRCALGISSIGLGWYLIHRALDSYYTF